jgi:Flp pilus assembly protein TadG
MGDRGMKRERRRGGRRGAAAVEFALCVSVLFMVIFAIIEFSRLLQLQHAVRQAALEGARTGMTLDATTASTQAEATKILGMVGVTNGTVTVSPNPLVYSTPSVSVTVSVDPAGNSWWTQFVTAGHPITATVTLDREVQAISVP